MTTRPSAIGTNRGFPACFMTEPKVICLLLIMGAFFLAPGGQVAAAQAARTAPQWQEAEIAFTATRDAANPYVDSEAWVDFTHDDGTQIRRPMFWDGGRTYRVRFASTTNSGSWRWAASDTSGDPGIQGQTGTLQATANKTATPTKFSTHGFWSIPPGGRNLIHADGTPRLLCADTPWALPWRATIEQAATYARDRRAKGFNAELLMTVQPDMKATGPRSRTEDLGFDVGFDDLPRGTLQQLNPVFDGLPLAGMEPNWIYTYGRRGLAVPGKLFVLYLPEGGDTAILSREVPRPYRVFDPRTGKVLSEGRLPDTVPAQAKIGPGSEPRVVVFTEEEEA
jgi:hypothetical protein